MDPLLGAILQQAPAIVLAVGLLIAYAKGLIRTRQEVEAVEHRAARAEAQVDTLVPLVEKLAEKIDRIASRTA